MEAAPAAGRMTDGNATADFIPHRDALLSFSSSLSCRLAFSLSRPSSACLALSLRFLDVSAFLRFLSYFLWGSLSLPLAAHPRAPLITHLLPCLASGFSISSSKLSLSSSS